MNREPVSARHARISAGLITAAEANLPSVPNPYLQRHLSAHVAESRDWDLLATHPDVLDRLDPTAVAADVLSTAFGHGPLPGPVAATVSAQHLLLGVAPEDRALIRDVAAARIGASTTARDDALARTPRARIRSSVLRRDPINVVLTGHTHWVTAVAAVPLPDGGTLLATGGWDGTVRLWY